MADPIEHVVVLMLENNSFDRMLGMLPGVDGVDPADLKTNPDYPTRAPVGQAVTTERRMPCDPAHDLDDCMHQLDGPGLGFVSNFVHHYTQSSEIERSEVMAYYPLGFLNVLHTLASNFLTCDQWFSSLPGPTWPNRFFVHSGTSLGHVDMPEGIFHPGLHLYNQPTVYQRLSEQGIPWSIYYGDFPQSIVMTTQWRYPGNYHAMDQFYADAQGPAGAFPQYSFIEPTYFGQLQNDQHPPSDVMRGELLLANVYNALRANQELWETTLLVILYDEHGGFYDHVPPPQAVPPDGNVTTFSFAEYGVRVPAVLVSPWLKAGVAHDVFDHTSVLKYVTEKWGLGPLGDRVASANSFAGYVGGGMAACRTDTPAAIAPPDVLDNPVQRGLNLNQTALVGFSRFLETKISDMALGSGAPPEQVFADVGQRLLASMQGVEQHAVAAVSRLELFLGLKKAEVAGGGAAAQM